MSQSCRKTFTIAPGLGANLNYYWTFDKPGEPIIADPITFYFTDEVGAAALEIIAFASVPANFLAPGKIGNAAVSQMDPAANDTVYQNGGISPGYDSAQAGVTIFGWFRYDSWPSVAQNNPLFELFLGGALPGKSLGVEIVGTGANPDFVVQPSGSTFTPAIGLGVFFFVCYTYTAATGVERVYINGALASTTSSAPMVGSSDAILEMGFSRGGSVSRFDEFGFSLGQVYSAARTTALYNTGSGVTWPAVNSI